MRGGPLRWAALHRVRLGRQRSLPVNIGSKGVARSEKERNSTDIAGIYSEHRMFDRILCRRQLTWRGKAVMMLNIEKTLL